MTSFFVRVFLLFPLLLAAGPSSQDGGFDKIINNYSKMGSFASDFTQTKKLTALGMDLKGKGTLQVSADKGEVLWQVSEPAPLSVKIDSKEIAITSFVPDVSGGPLKKQVQTFSLKEGVAGSQIAASVRPFLELFSGSTAHLHKEFTVEQKDDSYLLTPKNQHMPIKQMQIVPDATSSYLTRVVVFEKSGDRIEYDFSQPVKK